MSQLHIHLLGSFRLEYGGVPVSHVNSPRLQALLAALVLHCDSPQLEKTVESMYLFKGALARDAEYTNTRG